MSNTDLIDWLSALIWLQGVILCIAGTFYLMASTYRYPDLTLAERSRIVRLLGACMWGIGLSEIATGWARGLIRYLQNGGSETLGEAVLLLRIVNVILMMVALIDVVLTWRRANGRMDD